MRSTLYRCVFEMLTSDAKKKRFALQTKPSWEGVGCVEWGG